MLELIVLYFLTRQIGQIAERKGEKPGTWKLYTVLAWISGEIFGLMLGTWIFGPKRLLMIALVAIPCAIAGYHLIRHTLEKKPDFIHDDQAA